MAHPKIGRYEVIREIGRGGMGIVYLAHDPFIERRVAIKTTFAPPAKNSRDLEQYQQSFFNEARAAGKLVHPHIVAVYDAMWMDDRGSLIMEYVEGDTLKEYCSAKDLTSVEQAIKFIFQCARALDYAHQNGVIHRDIKPSNILVSNRDVVKISDFGIAHIEGRAAPLEAHALTGSAAYASPEQLDNAPLTPQTDLFSLGVVAYELLTGVNPFKADSDVATVYRIANEDPEPMEKHRQDVAPSLEGIVMKALEKNVTKRYRTGFQLAADLSSIYDNLRFLEEEMDSDEKLEALKKLSFFKEFSPREIDEVIKNTQWIRYEDDETVITEGEIDHCFYVIVTGAVKVEKDGKRLATLKQGDCFGEMAYLGTHRRTANIEAFADTILMKINSSIIEQISSSTQLRFYKVFSNSLIQRLLRTTELYSKEST